ncbi:MAG: hypothetical protein ACOZQL_24840 [Myxococcota bacterium]
MRHVLLAALSVLLVSACTKEAAKPAEKPATEPTKAAAAPLDTEQYAVAVSPKGALTAGQEGAVAITVTAKSGFHVNPEYPVAFKPEGFEALKFADEKVRLTAAQKTPCADKAEDTCVAEFPVGFTCEKAGAAKFAGTLQFSVCSADKCLIEKVPVTLALSAQ